MKFFYLKSPRFGKSLETFGSQIFFLRFLKSIGWYGFSYEFLGLCAKEIHRLSPMALKIYTLAKKPGDCD
jgi:hypothetical protein